MPTKIKLFFSILMLVEVLCFYTPAYAADPVVPATPLYSGVESGISQYLCTPSDKNPNGQDLNNCINKLYRFAIVVAGVVGMFFIVIAGYVYMSSAGNQESVDKAKSIFTSTITAIVILFASYVLLRAINPDLVQFQTIQPPNAPNAPAVVNGPPSTNNPPSSGPPTSGKSYTAAAPKPISGSTPLAIAQSQLGAREDCCDNSGSGKNAGLEVAQYFVPGGTLGQPWCLYFTTWAYGKAGYTTIGNLPGRGGWPAKDFYSNNNGKQFNDNGKKYTVYYYTKADITSGRKTISPGDMAFFLRGDASSGQGHGSLVESFDGTNITSIDGNISDSVTRVTRSLNIACTTTGENGVCLFMGVGHVQDN